MNTRCLSSCLQSALPSSVVSNPEVKPISADLANVPSEYCVLHKVFSKSRTIFLYLLTVFECTIDLPGAPLPISRLYNIIKCARERESMEKHISEFLAAGIICSPVSPLVAVFFFVGKKDVTLTH